LPVPNFNHLQTPGGAEGPMTQLLPGLLGLLSTLQIDAAGVTGKPKHPLQLHKALLLVAPRICHVPAATYVGFGQPVQLL
jgi:hypothetical protein